MKTAVMSILLLATGVSLASIVVGTPDIASMDPFCAS